jgi:hypothetical protein
VGTENHFHFHFYFYFSRGYSRLPDAETSFAWNLKLTVLGFSLSHQFSVSFDVDNFRISSLLAVTFNIDRSVRLDGDTRKLADVV